MFFKNPFRSLETIVILQAPRGIQFLWRALIILFISVVLFSHLFTAFAQNEDESSFYKTLESSLKSLKESAQEVVEENRLLISKNEMLKQRISNLQNELESLAQKKEGALGKQQEDDDGQEISQEISLLEEQIAYLQQDVQQLNEEQENFLEEIDLLKGQRQQIEEQNSSIKEEITQIEEKMKSWNMSLDDKPFQEERARLLRLLEEAELNLNKAVQRFRRLEERRAGPLKDINDLEEKQVLLKQDVSRLKEGIKINEDKVKSIHDEIVGVKEEDQDALAHLSQEVESLNLRKQELEKVLSEANDRIEKEDLISDTFQTEDYLKERLKDLRDENEMLKKEFFDLKKEFKTLEGR